MLDEEEMKNIPTERDVEGDLQYKPILKIPRTLFTIIMILTLIISKDQTILTFFKIHGSHMVRNIQKKETTRTISSMMKITKMNRQLLTKF